jgi:hypothetical protein
MRQEIAGIHQENQNLEGLATLGLIEPDDRSKPLEFGRHVTLWVRQITLNLS